MPSDGLRAQPAGTLVDAVLAALDSGSLDSAAIARDILGLKGAPDVVADRVVVALIGADPRVRRLGDGRWAKANAAFDSPKLAECVFSVVDVETTGLSAGNGDRIVEIAIVAATKTTVQLTYESLVNPERPVGEFTSSMTQITDEMVKDQPTFAEIADDVLAALAGRVFVAHNVSFDWGFVSRELRRARDMTLDGPKLCTVDLTRRYVKGLKRRNLDSVTEYFGVEIDGRHRAAGDAIATARVLQRLLELAQETGAVTVNDLRYRSAPRRKKRSALPRSMEEL
jgi:DNA polymerase-3 subunit epsilon